MVQIANIPPPIKGICPICVKEMILLPRRISVSENEIEIDWRCCFCGAQAGVEYETDA